MEKSSKAKVKRSGSTGGYVDGHRVLGKTREGIIILRPKGNATHFTDREILKAIHAVRSAKTSPPRENAKRTSSSKG
jgi:hypothetical protein